ncbi:MAG: AbrB/MazE/SpoVT family DNA-binding domain-containing protein [Saprospiraceae bacterium]|jgi:antitoxin MazE|nr:AbrB/MazE/SpoVT family DNA-binding domain-containing protein [Saprospiraceae bacterium]MBP8097304.1 AbrB/MazE/SpoVT family DNA-binding domain-containing protein [Saprospiraceae bacterium]
MTVTINKWGHSLGLRLPKDLAAKNDLEIGTVVEFLESPDGILIRKKSKEVTLKDIIDSYPKDYDPIELIPDLPSELW